jgi:hypothetical protein
MSVAKKQRAAKAEACAAACERLTVAVAEACAAIRELTGKRVKPSLVGWCTTRERIVAVLSLATPYLDPEAWERAGGAACAEVPEGERGLAKDSPEALPKAHKASAPVAVQAPAPAEAQ